MTTILADDHGKGRVFVCSNCSEIHVKWRDWMFKMDAAAFGRFAEMVRAADKARRDPMRRSAARDFSGKAWLN